MTPGPSPVRGSNRKRTVTAPPTSSAYIPAPILGGTPDAARRRGRAFRARLAADGATPSKSAATCQHLLEGSVSHGVTRSGVVHTKGIKRCGNVQACPVCAPVVRERRAAEIDAAASLVRASGGTVVFVTVTMPHKQRDKLSWLIDTVYKSWNQCWSGKSANNFRHAFGFLGQVRALEVTDMDLDGLDLRGSGWHPHIHALLFFEGKVTTSTVEHWITPRWINQVKKNSKGRRVPSTRHGVDVRAVRDNKEMAKYLAKVDGGWGAGLELARSDVKKKPGRHSVPELLDHAATGEKKYVKRWIEFEHAIYKRRAIQWTPGLKARLCDLAVPLLGCSDGIAEKWADLADEVTDEEAAAGSPDEIVVEFTTPGEVWMVAVRQGREHEILSHVRMQAIALGLCDVPDPPLIT